MKRTLSLLLLLATVLMAFGCASPETPDESAAITTLPSGDNTEPAETEDPAYKDDLPALNFNGTEIKVAYSDRDWFDGEIWVDGITGETVNDAVYNRNVRVEERLGVKIKNISIPCNNDNGSMVTAVYTALQSGDDLYDIVFANCYRVCMASRDGYFYNLAKVDNIDLTKKYWSQDYNDTVSFHGAQFSATGSIALSTMKFAFATFFNKRMFDERSVDYPYKAVSEGKWTLDYFLTLMPEFYQDADGDQKPSDGDVYSWIANDNMIGVDPYWVGCEIPILTKNAEGDYVYSMDVDKLTAVVEKLCAIFNSEGTHNFPQESGDAEQVKMSKSFADGKGAMASFRLLEAESEHMRDMQDKYGVVPMPKFNEDQQQYHTHAHDQYTVVTIMSNIDQSKLPMLGAFIEAMASQSYKDTVPAYYEVTLKFKYASDPESWEMLDIVINNFSCEAGNLYYDAIAKPHTVMRTLMGARSTNVASATKSYAKLVPKELTKLNDKLNALIK